MKTIPMIECFKKSVIPCLMVMAFAWSSHAAEFAAQGPTREIKLKPEQFLGAVQVTFDRLPTSMSFDLPWHFCAVSENGIKFAHFAAETYDPRDWDGQGADASFEAGMDEEGRHARVWIEHQSPARIVVRVRYALVNSKYQIAHADMQSDAPYGDGKGDWGDERFTIYPDGTYVRHMKIHTALAAMSRPFGFFREPPNVIHEFTEAIVIGPAGHEPTDDMHSTPALTLIKMFGNQPGSVFPEGDCEDIDYAMPDGPPDDYGEFRDANIMVLHAKSRYRPFTIGLPDGVKVHPYGWEEIQDYPFATWKGYAAPSIGYVSAIGHIVNHWHFRRTANTIEQVYLHGMSPSDDAPSKLMPLAWSWIVPPELQMPDAKKSPNDSTGQYGLFTYDQTQKAYVIPRRRSGPETLSFAIDAIYDDDFLDGTMWLVNPALVIPNWNDRGAIALELDGEPLRSGVDYRFGFEKTAEGENLVIWLDRTIDLNAIDEHRVEFEVRAIGY